MKLTRTILKITVLAALLIFAFAAVGTGPSAAKKSSKKTPCKSDLAHCPDQRCGGDFDPEVNKLKNTRPDDSRASGPATARTLAWMKNLDNPEEFEKGQDRDELATAGEGSHVSIVAYLIGIKPEGGESCNCGLTKKEWTDNHLVLVSKATVKKFPLDSEEDGEDAFHARERESIPAEFTPRVRLTHPNFTREKVLPLLKDAPEGALLVRVSGMLTFDSEHFVHNPLKRVNHWEVHPILKFEYCSAGSNCTAQSASGWTSLADFWSSRSAYDGERLHT